MKLALFVSEDFKQALNKLSSKNLKLKTAYKLKNILKKQAEEATKYEELRLAAIKAHAETDEKGNVLQENGSATFKEEGYAKFVQELAELGSVEVEVEKLSLEELGDIEMTAIELFFLDGILSQ